MSHTIFNEIAKFYLGIINILTLGVDYGIFSIESMISGKGF
jgi:hypothetical protein